MTFFGRQRSKPLPGVADGLPSLRWQFAKTLKPFAQLLLLLLGHLRPLLKPLPGLAPFLLIHGRPLSRAVAQPFLPFPSELGEDAVDVHIRMRTGSRVRSREVQAVGNPSAGKPDVSGQPSKK